MKKFLLAAALIGAATSVAAAQQLDLGGIGKADRQPMIRRHAR